MSWCWGESRQVGARSHRLPLGAGAGAPSSWAGWGAGREGGLAALGLDAGGIGPAARTGSEVAWGCPQRGHLQPAPPWPRLAPGQPMRRPTRGGGAVATGVHTASLQPCSGRGQGGDPTRGGCGATSPVAVATVGSVWQWPVAPSPARCARRHASAPLVSLARGQLTPGERTWEGGLGWGRPLSPPRSCGAARRQPQGVAPSRKSGRLRLAVRHRGHYLNTVPSPCGRTGRRGYVASGPRFLWKVELRPLGACG